MEKETDVDCGGEDCAACANEKSCAVVTDCASNFCDGGTCKSAPTDSPTSSPTTTSPTATPTKSPSAFPTASPTENPTTSSPTVPTTGAPTTPRISVTVSASGTNFWFKDQDNSRAAGFAYFDENGDGFWNLTEAQGAFDIAAKVLGEALNVDFDVWVLRVTGKGVDSDPVISESQYQDGNTRPPSGSCTNMTSPEITVRKMQNGIQLNVDDGKVSGNSIPGLATFDYFDSDCDGKLQVDDLEAMQTILTPNAPEGTSLTDEAAWLKDVVTATDPDGDKSISRGPFLAYFKDGLACPWTPCGVDIDPPCKPLGKREFENKVLNGYRFYTNRGSYQLFFNYYDADCDGKWDPSELSDMVSAVDILTRGQINPGDKDALSNILSLEWLKERDANGDGEISFDEYISVGADDANAEIAAAYSAVIILASVLGGLVCCCGCYATYKCRPEYLPKVIKKRFDVVYEHDTVKTVRSKLHGALDKVGLDYEVTDRRNSISRLSVGSVNNPNELEVPSIANTSSVRENV